MVRQKNWLSANLKTRVLSIHTIGDATGAFVHIQKAPNAMPSTVQVVQAHLKMRKLYIIQTR